MTKTEVIGVLNSSEFANKCLTNVAEVVCDIACNGEVVYPNEKILVIFPNYDKDVEGYCYGNNILPWTYCSGVEDFDEGIVYGAESAKKHYTKYYVDKFKKVKPFIFGDEYKTMPTSDLFQAVIEECDANTILDNAESFISKEDMRSFLLACLGEDVE